MLRSSSIARIIAALAVTSLVALPACASDGNNGNGDNSDPTVIDESTEYQPIRATEVVSELEHPWAVAFLPDGRKLITERPGRLLIAENGQTTEIGGLPDIHAHNQGGLLDVVLHPDYDENGWIYFTYSTPDGADTKTALSRTRLDDDENTLTDVEELFTEDRASGPGRHYGSRLAWKTDGTLLMTIGDRGADPPRAQELDDHAGTVIRLHDDGAVPDDNPFVDDADVLDEIWTYGNRNIQGLVVDPDDGTVWATEHGPRGGDLLHRLEGGNNYGWPIVTQGLNYADQEPFPHAEARSMEGVEEHVHEFFPTLAPSGLALVTTDRFQHWNGNLLAGGLRAERVRRIVVDEAEVLHQEELFLLELGRIRDIRLGPNENIWILTDEADASLYRVEPG